MNELEKEIKQVRNSITFQPSLILDKYKDSVIIFIVTHWHIAMIKKTIATVLKILRKRKDVYVVIIDNKSDADIRKYLKSLKHQNIELQFLQKNIGKALAVNFYIQQYISANNLPKTVISLDPDTTFSPDSFNYLIQGITNLPKIGMLGMRYIKNDCNPEKNIFFPPKRMKGLDGKTYKVSIPLMCNVAGPVFGIKGSVLKNDLDFKLFPKKFIRVYGGDDSATFRALRFKYKNGYLNGATATHWRTGNRIANNFSA